MKDLILRLSRENPMWSAERIGNTLRLLGYDPRSDVYGETPTVRERQKLFYGPSKLIPFSVCGGLHHRYERVAA